MDEEFGVWRQNIWKFGCGAKLRENGKHMLHLHVQRLGQYESLFLVAKREWQWQLMSFSPLQIHVIRIYSLNPNINQYNFYFSSFFAEWALVNILRLFPGTPPLTNFTSQGKSYITWRKNNNKNVHIIFHSQHTSALINFASFEHCVDTKLRSFRCNWKPLATQAGEICVIPMHKKRTTYTFRIKHKKGKCSYIVSNEKRLLFPNIHTQNIICWLMGIACWTSFVEYKYCFWCIWQEQKKKNSQQTELSLLHSILIGIPHTHFYLLARSTTVNRVCDVLIYIQRKNVLYRNVVAGKRV